MMQSVVSGVEVVMMVIDLHKGVWWEEEQEHRERRVEGYDGCVTAWVRSKQFKRGEQQHDKAYPNGRSSGKHSSKHVY